MGYEEEVLIRRANVDQIHGQNWSVLEVEASLAGTHDVSGFI
jgi:hypothetical protein